MIFSMKKQIGFLLILCAVMAPSLGRAFVERGAAVVRIMNKAAGKSQTVTIPVGRATEFEKLAMTVRSCKQTDPFQAENFHMFIEIDKKTEGRIFSGWMNRNEPGDNPLQNADYDVWLVKCE